MGTSRSFDIIATKLGKELGRVSIVALTSEEALESGRWLLSEQFDVDLFDDKIRYNHYEVGEYIPHQVRVFSGAWETDM